jgi:uncharacterized membrane protein YdjX (TVP38/TMEM64 family)
MTKPDSRDNSSNGNVKSFLALLFVFGSFVLVLYAIYLSFPNLEDNEKQFIKVPRNIVDAKDLGLVLKKYAHNHYYSVFAAFFAAYVFLQTFAIPGSIFLSILSGFLFPFPLALSLVCTCSTLGAVFCYFLSRIVARQLIMKYLRARILAWQAQVASKRADLLYYIIFLRVTPLVPNWFINLASPLIDIPLRAFALGTFIGVAPPSCLYIQAGQTLNLMTSQTAVFSWTSIGLLAVFSCVSLLPVVLRDFIKARID